MRDALVIRAFVEGVCQVTSPIAALRAIGVEHPLEMHRDIAERIGLGGNTRRCRNLDADIWIFGKCNRLIDRRRDGAVLQKRLGETHVVDDQSQVRVPLGDWSESESLAGSEEVNRYPGLLDRWPEPVCRAVRQPLRGCLVVEG